MKTCIHIKGLTKNYGEVRAVDKLDLSIPEGEIFGLLGPNGSGKTSTLECLLGMRSTDAGQCSILGLDPRGKRSTLFAQVGVQFQDPAWPEKIKVVEVCGLHDRLYRLAPGQTLATLAKLGSENQGPRLVTTLSGGEKQRLALTQALAHQPKAIFLDELTTGLDPEARRRVWDHLLEVQRQGATIFLTSHSMEEVQALCQRVALLRKGQIVFLGSPDELMAQTGQSTLEQAYLAHLKQEVSA